MSDWLKEYGVEGPLGFPMLEKQARGLDELLKGHSKDSAMAFQRQAISAAVVSLSIPTGAEVNEGERSDVSWISTEKPDKYDSIILSKGVNDAQFAQNPIVTLGHSYWMPPVGRSLWRKKIKKGINGYNGIKAKTVYPRKPDSWPKDDEGRDAPWPPDKVLSLVQAQMLNGKSIGFLPLKAHSPSSHEIAGNPAMAKVDRIYDEVLLLEYACVYLPGNPDTLVEQVSRGSIDLTPEILKALGMEGLSIRKPDPAPITPPPASLPTPSFVSEDTVARAVSSALAQIDFLSIAKNAIEEQIARRQGRI